MQHFRNIVVMAGGKDGGTAAIERATELAQRNTAKIKVVDFVEPLPDLLAAPGSDTAEAHRKLVDAKLRRLKTIVQPMRESGLSVVFELVEGPAEKIIDRVIRDRHDLMIKSAEEPPGVSQRIFGTTGLRILRKCPCPVWIIKTSGPRRCQRILAAVEPAPLEQQRDPLNIRILQMATSLAQQDQSELHVVYVWPHWTAHASSGSSRSDARPMERIKQEIEVLQELMLNKLLDPFRQSGHSFHTHLLKGDPCDLIAAECTASEIDLLVMGTIRRPSLLGFLMGSTAERVLDQVKCSVLTVKPDDFPSFTRG